MKKIFTIALTFFITFFVVSKNIKVSAFNEEYYKYYTNGIVDGGAYRIKNVQTGLYMTLANGSISPSTNIVLSSSSTSENQMFYVKYLGENKYLFEPYNSTQVKFGVDSSTAGTHLKLFTTNNSTSTQRFRITAINATQYTISTEISAFGSLLYAKYVPSIGWSVVHNSKNLLEEYQIHWEFEKVNDGACDQYTSYYIRDVSTNLYVTVNSTANNAQVSLMPFTGKEEQRFKRYYLSSDGWYGYYYVPMKKTDTAIELGSNTIINIFNKGASQKFIETYNSTTNGYRLSSKVASSTRYICKGESFMVDSTISYRLSTTHLSSSAIIFQFEEAHIETPFIYNPLERVSYNRLTSNYGEKHLYVIRPNISGDYTFFIKRNIGDAGMLIFNSSGIILSGTITDYENGQKIKVPFMRDKIYFIQIWDYDIFEQRYEFAWMKDLTVYIHGMNTKINDNNDDNANRRKKCAIPCRDLLNSSGYYDPIINTEEDMTSTFIRDVDPLTGFIPLQAPIYVFRGHGNSSIVTYSTGTETGSGYSSYLRNSDLYDFDSDTTIFDMNGNRFSAWIGCKTANGTNTIAEAAWKAGSDCSLGFTDSISRKAANNFTVNLFEEIMNGYNISNAVNRARSGISFWFSGLSSAVFFGNSSIILKRDVPVLFSNMRSVSSFSDKYIFDEKILEGYNLMYVSDDGTLKRYIKLIKGHITDDYIDVYYEKDDVVGFYKSKTTYSNKDISSMENFDRYFNNKDDYKVEKTIYVEGKIKAHIVNTDVYEQVYTYDGITIPLCFYVSIYQDLDGNSHRDIKVVNMMTRMVVSEEVMFE